MGRLVYPVTNENIYAIKHGLNPKEGDRIFSILGSGDQAFMFIESGANVFAVDKSSAQVDYVRERISALESGNSRYFRMIGKGDVGMFFENSSNRDIYFDGFDCELFKGKLGNLEITCGDFFNFKGEVDYSAFNKVYLSNAFDYMDGFRGMRKFFDKFDSGTLFYMASFCSIRLSDYRNVVKDEELSLNSSVLDSDWNVAIFEKR